MLNISTSWMRLIVPIFKLILYVVTTCSESEKTECVLVSLLSDCPFPHRHERHLANLNSCCIFTIFIEKTLREFEIERVWKWESVKDFSSVRVWKGLVQNQTCISFPFHSNASNDCDFFNLCFFPSNDTFFIILSSFPSFFIRWLDMKKTWRFRCNRFSVSCHDVKK